VAATSHHDESAPFAPRRPVGWKDAYADADAVVVDCPLCASADAEELAEEFTLTLARCSSCGLAYVRRRPLDPDANYRPEPEYLLRKYGPVLRGEQSHTRDGNYDELLDRLELYRGGGRLLDVGPFMGFFARRALGRGWHVEAVDQSPVLAAIVREQHGIEVRLGAMHEVALEPEFDVVTILDVIEHVSDPVGTLRSARAALRPGGVVLVKTPNVRWNHVKHRLRQPDSYDMREHIVQFDGATLAATAERAELEPLELFVPRPVQTGGAARRLVRRAVWTAGAGTHRLTGRAGGLSPDLCLLARRPAGV
jgi:2-polyprenyl-3-methyl-5-hydroxy-6-metoxy-1,4-benzoquinol methylase